MVFQGRIWGDSVSCLMIFQGRIFGGIVCCSLVLWFARGEFGGNSVVVLSYGFPGEDLEEGIVCCSLVLWFSKGGFGGIVCLVL